ncbi:tetratricopeptide repeat protein, partial [Chloroflexi bacterium TSY]|nr:tetratricopeptide repeat protein [Chloroflexi bacterium TSY]
MNEQLTIKLLGTPELYRAGETVSGFRSSKAQALFYYLAATRRAHTRATLAGLFWGDVAEQYARRSLTSTLSNLRHLFADRIQSTRETIAFVQTPDDRLDIFAFVENTASQEATQLQQAVDCYHGDFLEGVYIQDAPEFEQWILIERTRYRNLLQDTLIRLADLCAEMGDLSNAITHTRHLLTLEPWHEESHRQLMRFLTQSGQRNAALAHFEHCQQILQEELGVEPDSDTIHLVAQIRSGQLERRDKKLSDKGDAEQTSLKQPKVDAETEANLETSQLLERASSPKPIHLPTHNLPAQSTPFVGRQRELAETLLRLQQPACRLLTLLGSGGMGKSRLALQAARVFIDATTAGAVQTIDQTTIDPGQFAAGVFFIPLQAVQRTAEILTAIAEAIQYRPTHSESLSQESLFTFLADKELLLVLDNFEHLLSGALLLTELLVVAPQVKLLVTSREPLNLREEWLQMVTGMYITDPEGQTDESDIHFATTTTEELDSAELLPDAVQLFLYYAHQTRPDLVFAQHRADVLRICRLVGGSPLGIELATTWLKAFPPKQIALEIERNLDILTTHHQNVPERHRSMRAVLEQSWQMVPADERQILIALAVFQGDFQAEAAIQITGASWPILMRLTEKMLVQTTSTGRYHLHELLRQFLQDKRQSQQSGDGSATEVTPIQDIEQKHSHYYLNYLASRRERLIDDQQGLEEIRTESENILGAWQWAVAHGELTLIRDVCNAFCEFYWTQRSEQEGTEVLAHTLIQLEQLSQSADHVLNNHLMAEVRLTLLRKQALFFYGQGTYADAAQLLQESISITKSLGRELEIAFAQNILGTTVGWQGHLTEAIDYLEQALAVVRRHQDWGAIADNLQQLAQSTAQKGDYAAAQRLIEESLRVCRRHQLLYFQAYALPIQARIDTYIGHYAQAERRYHESLAIFQRLEHQRGIVNIRSGLASLAWQRAVADPSIDLSEVKAFLEQMVKRPHGTSNRILDTFQLVTLAQIYVMRDELEQAERCADDGLMLAQSIGSYTMQVYHLLCLTNIAYKQGSLNRAR